MEENGLAQGYGSFQRQSSSVPQEKDPALLPYLGQLQRAILSSALTVRVMESAMEIALQPSTALCLTPPLLPSQDSDPESVS